MHATTFGGTTAFGGAGTLGSHQSPGSRPRRRGTARGKPAARCGSYVIPDGFRWRLPPRPNPVLLFILMISGCCVPIRPQLSSGTLVAIPILDECRAETIHSGSRRSGNPAADSAPWRTLPRVLPECPEPSRSTLKPKEIQHVRNNSDRGSNLDASWSTASLAPQPSMGVLPKRRARPSLFDLDYPAGVGADLGVRLQPLPRGYHRFPVTRASQNAQRHLV